MLVRILVVSAHSDFRQRFERLTSNTDTMVAANTELRSALRRARDEGFELLLLDERLGQGGFPEALTELEQLEAPPGVVLIQNQRDAESQAGYLAAGCTAVLAVDLPDSILADALGAIIQRQRDTGIGQLAAEERDENRLGDFASNSDAMSDLLQVARRVTHADTSVLILGETGVGKEWLARAIHAESDRGGAPFLALNCVAVPDQLLESELFGHERGAFTSADRARRGVFELAHRGTLLLDEIAEMPLHMQAKLLRVLQDRRVRRLGGEVDIEVDVRIMAATNLDIDQALSDRTFRPDLYYRLGVITLTIPPLRERREDIPLLVETYRQQFAGQLARDVSSMSSAAMDALLSYSWPGNVRELINVMERAVLLAPRSTIELDDLPVPIRRSLPNARVGHPERSEDRDADVDTDRPLDAVREVAVATLERTYLRAALRRTSGRVGETAQLAGISPRALYDKMRRYGLRKEDFRS